MEVASARIVRYATTMRVIDTDIVGPIEITGPALISAHLTGDVVVAEGANVRLTGDITGTVTVRRSATLVVIGRIKGTIINEGGAVDLFGFVGKVRDVGDTETWASAGAIVAGQRVKGPSRVSALDV